MTEKKTLFWKTCLLTERDRRNQRQALIWMFAWVVSWVAASIAIKEGLVAPGWPATLLAVLSTLLGVVMILVFIKFLRQADELLRKIQVEALALGFGAGYVGAITYNLLEKAGAVVHPDPADLTLIMVIVYALGVVISTRRYA